MEVTPKLHAAAVSKIRWHFFGHYSAQELRIKLETEVVLKPIESGLVGGHPSLGGLRYILSCTREFRLLVAQQERDEFNVFISEFEELKDDWRTRAAFGCIATEFSRKIKQAITTVG